jgi:amidase
MHPIDAGALATAAAIADGSLGSEEAVAACFDRIAATEPHLNSFVDQHREVALREARKKDARAAQTPFHGVPIGIKDLNFVRFHTTRFGSQAMPHLWSPMDDVSVSRLRAAGFVIVGKTACSELGVLPITEPAGQPPTRNPWALDRTAGGSSGGAASAVSSGQLPVAHGSDGGGSIRIPASFCGLVGMKPSRGRVPNHLGLRDPRIIYTCGALTRTVADAEALLRVQGGQGEPAREGPLRVRVVLDIPLLETDPAIRASIQAAAAVLAADGHIVEEGEAPQGNVDDFLPIWQHLFAQIPIMRWSRAEPVTRWLGEQGKGLRAADVHARQAALTARWGSFLDGVDVLLTPTVGVPPPLIGHGQSDDGEAQFRQVALLGAWTAPFNVTGHPALSVPVGLHPMGTPMGAQLAGPMGSEATLFALARSLERAFPSHARPVIWAGRPASSTGTVAG